jgi:hypothetical protein
MDYKDIKINFVLKYFSSLREPNISIVKISPLHSFEPNTKFTLPSPSLPSIKIPPLPSHSFEPNTPVGL